MEGPDSNNLAVKSLRIPHFGGVFLILGGILLSRDKERESMTFKVGDLVRLTGPAWNDADFDINDLQLVEKLDSMGRAVIHGGWIVYDKQGDDWAAEKVASQAKVKISVNRLNAVNPNHYVFPGGVEVRQISAHLTSFGGQAVQYVARATRLDGQNKGEAVEDLKKAIKFLTWEIERIEENE